MKNHRGMANTKLALLPNTAKIGCVLCHWQLHHATGYTTNMLTRTVTLSGNWKSNEDRNAIVCDFNYPALCYIRIQELSVQTKNQIPQWKTSNQPVLPVKPKTNSLDQCWLQMISGRLLSRQLSFTAEEQSSFSNWTIFRVVPDINTVKILLFF